MALFKILRGGYASKPENLTDGWAYFTPDNKGFYIDVGSVNGYNYNERIQINEKVIKENYILEVDSWISKTYALSIDSKFTEDKYLINVEPILSGGVEDIYEITSAVAKANLSYVLDGDNQRIFFVANGTQPIINIPITVEFIPKEINYITFVFDRKTYYAIDGMTWREFLSSPLNIEGWSYNTSVSGIVTDAENSSGDLAGILTGLDDIIYNKEYYLTILEECCFIAGTKILMADNSSKNIENINIGDKVISYNVETGENYITTVKNVITNKNSIRMAKITFGNGQTLEMTEYHPIYTTFGWKSLTNHMGYETLTNSDIIKTTNGWDYIVSIEQYILE